MGQHTVAVIPVFRPPADLADAVAALLNQVDDVVLVDDGSRTLEALNLASEHVHTRSLASNSGIATALNVAVEVARELGATHIVTLDQDSRLAPDHVARLMTLLEKSGDSVIGAVPGIVGGAPVLIDANGAVFDPIQSGQVLRSDAMAVVGEFARDLFIDAVDSDYTVRARLAGFDFVVDPDLSMPHELGTLVPITVFGKQVKLGGRPRNVLYHSPRRTYYMVRNSVWLARTYGKNDRAWMRLRNRKMTEMVVGGSVLAPDRFRQLRAAFAGWRDGRRGKLGPIPPSLLRTLERGK